MAATAKSRLKRAQNELQEALVKLELQEVQTLHRMAESWEDPAYPYDAGTSDWTVVWDASRGEVIPYSDTDLGVMRGKCRQLYYSRNVFMRNIVRNAINYVVGADGIALKCQALDDGELEEEINAIWDMFVRNQKLRGRQHEMVERGMLDGEFFIRYFDDDALKLRFIEPECVKDAAGKHTHGIEVDSTDAETVIRYFYTPFGASTSEAILADEVLHVKFLGTASMKRGIPPHGILLDRMVQYDGWLRDRIILNRVRSQIVLIRKHIAATAAQITAFANAKKTSSAINPNTGQEERYRKIKPGTMIDTSGNTEYEYLAPNVQASDVRYDGREIKLAIAVGAGQPEYMVTADASNASFSSTWIAEAPGVRQFEMLQGIICEALDAIWHRRMLMAINAGEIARPPDMDEEHGYSGYDPVMEPPLLVTRTRLDETKANEIEFNAGVLSRKTWRQRDELDDQVEQDNLEGESADDVGLGLGEPPPEVLPEPEVIEPE